MPMDRRMDIFSLLSPQDSPSGKSSPAPPAPPKPTSSCSGRNSTPTPTPVSDTTSSSSPHQNFHKPRSSSARPGMISSLINQVRNNPQLRDTSPQDIGQGSGTGTPPSNEQQQQQQQQQQQPPARQTPTPGIDALADLASMQRPQPHRANPSMIRNTSTEIPESQMFPSPLNPKVNPVPRNPNPATPRSHYDGSDVFRESGRRDFCSSSLTPKNQQMASELYTHIQQNRHAYESRVKFIRLLHQGFVEHVYPPSSPDSRGDPHTYDVLQDLRAAREELDSLFAIGEDLWAEWIQDESVLARTVDEQIGVMKLCSRSVDEEYGSTKLWIIYGEWMLYLYNSVSQPGEDAASCKWSEEERLAAQTAFTWQSVVDVWSNAAEATNWRINDSHLVWDRYLELVVQDVEKQPSPEKLGHVRELFVKRLQVPHSTWDQTFQMFSNFISTYDNNHYEEAMVDMTNRAAHAKALWNAREEREAELRRAVEAGDSATEWSLFVAYIEWELSQNRRKGKFSFDLVCALYQRAVLRFPTDVTFWEDYIMFLVEESMNQRGRHNAYIPNLPSLERATRHCPWSGSLWSQHILSAERAGRSFTQIADVKHKATRTGLLDTGGVDEVIKVHTTWCSYLRRRAFQPDSTDEDLDVAEVGIRSAIESIQELGERHNNTDNKTKNNNDKSSTPPPPNDPLFRLERIYIRYLSESGSWDSARETFKSLATRHGHSYEFWLLYYTWELLCWSKFTQSDGSASASRRTPNPSLATAVLKQALQRNDLDWPEKIMAVYIDHCEHYEDADELQLAVVRVRRAMKVVTRRREEEAVKLQQQQQQEQTVATAVMGEGDVDNEITSGGGKRKWTKEMEVDDGGVNGSANKKAKAREAEVEMEMDMTGGNLLAPALKRDRENATVIVKRLPPGVTEMRVRQFFRDCGKINSLSFIPSNSQSQSQRQTKSKSTTASAPDHPTAIIEFNTHEDALAAQTRNHKQLDDYSISVNLLTESTLFVTNFPPAADEAYVRDLFAPYGEILGIRFPSLKYNTHRRFCYVQFQSPHSAHAAVDGLNGHIQHIPQQQHIPGSVSAQHATTTTSSSPSAAAGGSTTELALVVKISDPRKRQDRTGPMVEGREVHVSNLDWKVGEEELRELFEGCVGVGGVEGVRIPRKANGGSKGFGFVVFRDKESAEKALSLNDQPFHSRPLHVHISTTTGPKRTATTILSHVITRSPSPSTTAADAANGTSPTKSTTTTTHPKTRQSPRTLTLHNIPDTLNDSRIHSLVSPYGPLVKIILRPEKQLAIAEFVDVGDAGRAALGLEGMEIGGGKRISVSVGDEKEVGKGMGKGKGLMMQPATMIRRPGQPGVGAGGRGGRKGGLGVKRGGGAAAAAAAPVQGQGKKSNEDFRAMVLSGKTNGEGQRQEE
ncbi:hypothetical protein ACO22_06551 [Paracoccidioides brasiliensis]|uniref:U4/U6 snRNA-associated-splicing factor PRP24 n=1 Tax=Paracoccidioides brasiliensis TaxID=121759 RepID=A0A1D2J754_PARBR|nr:hypothetical protein ACO22_06551 [Paracoccidioides brasiliensis]